MKKTDNKKDSVNENDEINLTDLSLDDIEEAYDEANSSDEFEISSDNTGDIENDDIDLSGVEDELNGMEDMAGEMEDIQGGVDVENGFEDKLKQLYDMIGGIIGKGDDSQTEIEPEIEPEMGAEIEETAFDLSNDGMKDEELPTGGMPDDSDPLSMEGGLSDDDVQLESVEVGEDEKLKNLIQAFGEFLSTKAEPEAEPESEAEPEAEIVDETLSISRDMTQAGQTGNPNPHTGNRRREPFQEAYEKRIKSMISESKKTSKKYNELKKSFNKVLVENKGMKNISKETVKLQESLLKYRDQLQEMAVFNTNLVGVNNILVNENFSLNIDEKKNVINKFNNANTITESENVYKSLMNEFTVKKKSIDENVEDKFSNVITPSTDNKLNEQVKESTAYADNSHISKIKGLMKYVDNHGM